MKVSRLTLLASWGVVLAVMAEGVYALLQLAGYAPRGHALYPATGTFYNPGPLCGFMAMGVVVAAWWLWRNDSRVRSWAAMACLLVCAAVMPALMARTGWVAAALGVGVVWCGLNRGLLKRNLRKVAVGLGAVTVVAVVAAMGLYLLKPESAKGRLLLWKMGWRAMVSEGGAMGIGWHNVAGAIGRAQEAYFMSGAGSPGEIAVAGAPDYAFNEFLQVGIAYGWVGLAVMLAVVMWVAVVSWRRGAYGITGATVAFVVVCFGSYPLQFCEYFVMMALLMVGAIGSCRWSVWGKAIASLAAVGVCGAMGMWRFEIREQEREIIRQTQMLRYSPQMARSSAREVLDGRYGWSHRYLFEMGKALRETGRLDESDSLLRKGMERSSDPMFLVLLGRNAHDRGDATGAEQWLRRAEGRIPSRLYPRYLLALLYADSVGGCDTARAVAEAERALAMDDKVKSPATEEMRATLRELIKKAGESN